MIGYLAPLAPSAAERRLYRGYQCGLCHTLGAEYGLPYRLFAGPDMVFLNVFLDLAADRLAPEGRRACVLAPGVSSLPARARTAHTRLAAAFGVYMAVEKLRDDWEDDRAWLAGLAWRALRPGWARARAALVDAGFPVESVEEAMRGQARIERGGACTLAEASAPTRAIARVLFGHAGAAAGEAHRPGFEALGDRVGAFLFYFDNLLDLERDLRAGSYNALARALGLRDVATPEARTAGLAGARAQVDDLEGLVATLPLSAERGYVARTLVAGFRDKLRRYEALAPEARAAATLRDVLPPRARIRVLDAHTWAARLRSRVTDALARLRYRARLTAALGALWLAPRTGWAEEWWPEGAGDTGLDSGLPDTGVALLGGADPLAASAAAEPADESLDCCTFCDPVLGNYCWVSLDGSTCCEGVCDGADCGSGCGPSCG